MGFEDLWGIGFGSIMILAVFAGLFYLKRSLRARLFPRKSEKTRGEALAELYLLRSRLERMGSGSEELGEDDPAE